MSIDSVRLATVTTATTDKREKRGKSAAKARQTCGYEPGTRVARARVYLCAEAYKQRKSNGELATVTTRVRLGALVGVPTSVAEAWLL